MSKDKNIVLAFNIINAVRDNNWEEMLKLFPEGVEHRTYKYDSIECFTDWEHYQDYARYVAPARDIMKEKCLDKALECLNVYDK
jgi:hypothetical protein